MLQFITNAYIDKTTTILDRIFYAWSTVFICRFWFTWLRSHLINETQTRTTKRQPIRPSVREIERNFITFPVFHCIELNAHALPFILVLVLNKRLPVESLNIYLFCSQPSENVFRCARALSGPFSSMTNFTVQEFLSKTRKIAILNEIKTLEEGSLDSDAIKFPVHHKHSRNDSTSTMLTNADDLTIDQIEENVYKAYDYAKSFIEKLGMAPLLKQNDVFHLNDLCSSLHHDLTNMIYITDDYPLDSDDTFDENIDSANDVTINPCLSSNLDDESESDVEFDSDLEDADSKSAKDNFNGMRIFSSVIEKDKHKFFEVSINGVVKFMHKQTAVWYLTKKNNHLSSDRLVRVQKVNQQK